MTIDKPATEQNVSELAVVEGKKLARRVFAKRGNNSEAHVSELELAALLALAFHRGELNAQRLPDSIQEALNSGDGTYRP